MKEQLKALIDKLGQSDLAWVSGYATGRLDALYGTVSSGVSRFCNASLGIYYATETGNSKKIATALEKLAKEAGAKVKNQSFSKIKANDLKNFTHHIFILSTHGEGEYPDSAKSGIEVLMASDNLDSVNYHIIGLGDSSYTHFCGAAVNLEKLLLKKKSKSFIENALFDVDYNEKFQAHLEKIISSLGGGSSTPTIGSSEIKVAKIGTSRLNPAVGVVTDSVNLNDDSSDKQTFHIEIACEGLVYEVGDALGIIFPESFVDESGKTPAPRLYSISSSQKSVGDNVHITVGLAKHKKSDGSIGYGLCSGYLAGLKEGDELKIYVHKNEIFKLPKNEETPIIMVGPGTGIAPFRAFIQEREATGASGKNWLFFGDRTSHADFLYQAEWQDYVASGVLTNIDLAFSRDDENHKIYVQDKMRMRSKELVTWLNEGAYFYVCGSKDPMSKDVEKALLEIAKQEKGISDAEAVEWLNDLTDSGRYLKDVY